LTGGVERTNIERIERIERIEQRRRFGHAGQKT
jgi:hypothetical protein